MAQQRRVLGTFGDEATYYSVMPLSNEERERIREEEWVRLQAQEDFYQTNPRAGWKRGRRGQHHPGYFLAFVGLVLVGITLVNIVDKVNWNQLIR